MRAFITRRFHIWATTEGLTEAVLAEAVEEITQGLTGDNLGGNVYKKRVRMPGRGKRGGARTLIAYRAREKVFFTFGFAKNERENIDNNELKAVKKFAEELLAYTEKQLKQSIENGGLREIKQEVKKNGESHTKNNT